MNGVFMCGCNLGALIRFGYTVRHDAQGHLICPCHGERLYGWRTHEAIQSGKLPTQPSMIQREEAG